MNNSDRNNPRRLIRAIEVASSPQDIAKRHIFDALFLALIGEKKYLEDKIKLRVEKRLEQGALRELETLLKMGYTFKDPGLNANGYIHLKSFILKEKSFNDVCNDWIRGEVDHTRRQLVFLKKMKDATLLDITMPDLVEKIDQLVYKWLRDAKN